jgi:hypothetical protein
MHTHVCMNKYIYVDVLTYLEKDINMKYLHIYRVKHKKCKYINSP